MSRFVVIAVFAATLGLGISRTAAAAGVPTDAPGHEAPTTPPYNWAGFYAGGQVGGGWSKTNLTNTRNAGGGGWPDLDIGQTIGFLQNGFVGGGHVGYNFQNGNWVYGVELSGSGANIDGDGTPPPGPPYSAGDDNFESKIRALLLVTGRLGYAWDRTLLYTKGGYAGASIRTSVTDSICPGNPNSCGSGSDTNWRSGFTIGTGLEYAVADHWIVGVEYDYARLNGGSVNLSDAKIPYVFNDDARNVHLLFGRLSYKFGGR